MERFTSRKFLLAIVGAVVAFGNAFFDWNLSNDEVFAVLLPILTFIGVEGASDIYTARTQALKK